MEHVFGKHRSEGSHSSSVAATSKLFLYYISEPVSSSEGIFGGNIAKAHEKKNCAGVGYLDVQESCC